MSILSVRPFIKATAFSSAVKAFLSVEEIMIHTGQHYNQNMSDIFFDEMDILELKYMLQTGGKSHGAIARQQLEKIEEILLIEKPNLVLVYGDTDSTLAEIRIIEVLKRALGESNVK